MLSLCVIYQVESCNYLQGSKIHVEYTSINLIAKRIKFLSRICSLLSFIMSLIIDTNPSKRQFDLDALIAAQDRCFLFPITFAYDYMPQGAKHLAVPAPPIVFRNPYQEADNGTRQNGIPLNPFLARLPWHTGLTSLRQNKYWEVNLRCTTELLHLFAEDVSNSAQNPSGRRFAHFARKELETGSFDRYSRFTTYMFPHADERRTALLAQVILLIVIFDGTHVVFQFSRSSIPLKPYLRYYGNIDTWEELAPKSVCTLHDQGPSLRLPRLTPAQIRDVRDVFVQLVQGNILPETCATPLQKRIIEVHRGFLEEDAKSGNGGADVITALLDFCRHPPPVHIFASIREYLDYRYVDVAMP